MCRREIDVIRRLEHRSSIQFIDVSGSTPASCPIDRGSLLARFHAAEDGRLLSGAAAFAAMWRAIRLLRPIGLAARNTVVLSALEALYRVFLRSRPSLQKFARRLEAL